MNCAAHRLSEPAAPASTETLVDRARGGDASAFADLYRAEHRRIYALCVRLTADAGRAEELTQDTFVNAWRRLGDYRGEARFSTWLHQIALNVVLSHQRRHGPWLRWLHDNPDELPEAPERVAPTGLALDLERAIARLPTRARQVFVLVDVEGYTHEQTAKALNMAIGTSKAHLFRARALLRDMLA